MRISDDEIEDQCDTVDQIIAWRQVEAINRLASAVESAFPFPYDLAIGKPLVDLAANVGEVGSALTSIGYMLEQADK